MADYEGYFFNGTVDDDALVLRITLTPELLAATALYLASHGSQGGTQVLSGDEITTLVNDSGGRDGLTRELFEAMDNALNRWTENYEGYFSTETVKLTQRAVQENT